MQTNRLTTKPTHQVLAAIEAMDLESVKVRLMDPELGEGWTQEYADSIETAYRTYLSMLARYQEHAEDIMLAKDVDEFWHAHILQTMKYADDCQNVFGAFLHHNPHVGRRTAEDMERRAASAEATRRLYANEYGDRSDRAWSGGISPERAAYSSAAVDAVSAAYSSAAIRQQAAAYSSAAITAGNAAYSSAAIREQNAAYSNAAIREQNAAYSSAAITAEKAAYSSAALAR